MYLCTIILASALSFEDPAGDGPASSDEKSRVQESTARVLELARKYEFYAEAGKRRKLELQRRRNST